MTRVMKRTLTLVLAVIMSVGLLSACGKKKQEAENEEPTKKTEENVKPKGEPTVIRIGTHNRKGVDPSYKDPVTGESLLDPMELIATNKALKKIKDEFNVEYQWIQYPGQASEVLLKSVLTNDPICEVAGLPGSRGVYMGQNILQSLDKYEDEFKDFEYAWMYPDKIFGHHFLMNQDMQFTRSTCLSYNITYLEKVDALKENGKTVLPTDLWKQGKWTWSTFKDYLTKINAYYANKKAPVRTEVSIVPYGMNIINTTLGIIKSTGVQVYSDDGIKVSSNEVISAVKYVEDLVAQKLIVQLPSVSAEDEGKAMGNGETVFANIANWVGAAAGEELSKRGECMGVVPFPRPDNLSKDDPKYQQLANNYGGCGILRGVKEDMKDLCIKTFKVFYRELLINKYEADSIKDLFGNKENAREELMAHGFDAANERYGDDMVEAYMSYNPKLRANEFYYATPWVSTYNTLLKNSILGLENTPKYETAISSQEQTFKEQTDEITSIVGSDKVVDNIPPAISLVDKGIAFPKGTDIKNADWSKYIKATDNMDGAIDVKSLSIDSSLIKADTAGLYTQGLVVKAKDKEGNEREAKFNVAIYDPDNKEAPTLTMKETYRAVKLNEDASKINWGKDFVEAATSKEGFDLKGYIIADISSLDVTTAGKYEVTLTVTDYAGNKAEQKIEVTVAGK